MLLGLGFFMGNLSCHPAYWLISVFDGISTEFCQCNILFVCFVGCCNMHMPVAHGISMFRLIFSQDFPQVVDSSQCDTHLQVVYHIYNVMQNYTMHVIHPYCLSRREAGGFF